MQTKKSLLKDQQTLTSGLFKVPEQFRATRGPLASDSSIGNNGFFFIPHPKVKDYYIVVVASNSGGWDHLSVSINSEHAKNKTKRCPTWEEMCFVKGLFWDEKATVIQYHPAKDDYINNHPACLHLWRPQNDDIPTPPPEMVGLKELNPKEDGSE